MEFRIFLMSVLGLSFSACASIYGPSYYNNLAERNPTAAAVMAVTEAVVVSMIRSGNKEAIPEEGTCTVLGSPMVPCSHTPLYLWDQESKRYYLSRTNSVGRFQVPPSLDPQKIQVRSHLYKIKFARVSQETSGPVLLRVGLEIL